MSVEVVYHRNIGHKPHVIDPWWLPGERVVP
jgi:hypothetical protein